MEDHGNDGTAGYGHGCAQCEGERRRMYDVASREALEGIAARFGDDMAAAAHGVIHGHDLARTRIPYPWSPIGADGAAAVTDGGSPALDGRTLRSLIRLFNAMDGISEEPIDGTTSQQRMMRCLSLIMTAGVTGDAAADHGRAERYAAAAVIHSDSLVSDAMHPLVGLDDISAFLEDAKRTYEGEWQYIRTAATHRHLAALTRMHMDGAGTDELAAATDLLMLDRSPMMETVAGCGERASVAAARAVLGLHAGMRPGRRETEETGWAGNMDERPSTLAVLDRVVAAIAEAGRRICEGTAADPGTKDGRAAMGRAADLLAGAAKQVIMPKIPVMFLACAQEMMDRSLTCAVRSASDDPDVIDMLVRISRTGRMIDDGREHSLTGPVLAAGGRGAAALADAACLDAEGFPKGFITETMLADAGEDGIIP